MDESGASCGGAATGAILGTAFCIAVLAFGAWWLHKKYWKNKSSKLHFHHNHIKQQFTCSLGEKVDGKLIMISRMD